uniref:SPRY domain-containing protein n=1 Tax=Meloidogyne hapla TaxID=6305 RepID=A0A1I8B4L0_MELHA
MIMEQTNQFYEGLYLNNKTKFLCNGSSIGITNQICYQKFSWKDGDIFGCGLVFPPRNNLNSTLSPYVFFTKNGNKIGAEILIDYVGNISPIIGLLSCSVETNFGNDLDGKPFCYDI